MLGPAIGGAAVAGVLVLAVAALVHRPLTRVPENAMKFGVGVMLTSFGSFWGAEGAGASWPGGDTALLVIIPAVALVGLGMARWLARAPRLRMAGDAV
jgi:uncharacterized membrane protein